MNYLEKKYRGGAAVEHSYEETVQLAIAALQVCCCAFVVMLTSAWCEVNISKQGSSGANLGVNAGRTSWAPHSDSPWQMLQLAKAMPSPRYACRLPTIRQDPSAHCPPCTCCDWSESQPAWQRSL